MNFNTLLLTITIGVMSWIGYETVQSGKEIASMKTKMEQIAEIKHSIKEIEDKLRSTVTQGEFDSRLHEVERRVAVIEGKFKR